jgi:hypothetical protein
VVLVPQRLAMTAVNREGSTLRHASRGVAGLDERRLYQGGLNRIWLVHLPRI